VGITPWAAFIGVLIILWNLPRLHLEKVIPLARDTMFENISDCILVLDMQNHVLDLNPAAERLIGCSVSSALGLPLKQIWPDWQNQLITSDKNIEASGELVLKQSGQQKTYNLHVSTVTDLGGRPTSKVFLLADITERKQTEVKLDQSYQKLQKTLESTILTIAFMAETRDPYTSGHQKRVSKLACKIAEEMGLSPEKMVEIRTGGILHDVGKMQVPSEILSKPGKLSEIEFSLIKVHSQVGYDIIKNIEFSGSVAKMILQHHERLNGSGYPQGLHNGEIIVEAKILAVADVVEAMASHRPYRPALGIDIALAEITKNKGILYDEKVVDACVRLFKEKGFKFE
jgi:PAS domain S-box-containing protein/putative nucleotidyltransferase with HDIG domain